MGKWLGKHTVINQIEGYAYDEKRRRSHSVDEEGRVTRYGYNNRSQLVAVLYPWTTEKAESDRKEAEEAGLYFTADKGNGERYTFNSTELAALRDVLNRAAVLRGNAVTQSQTVWRETYTYDRNGNRASKTTPWGTIRYEYDAENRLVRKGDIAYTNDRDGNTLSEKGLRYEAAYEYNGQNRMTYSEVTSHADRTHTVTMYEYDALGRRTLTQSVTGQTMRTLYDGKGFEVIREGETFRSGSLTTRYATGTTVNSTGQAPSTRYRWIGENGNAVTTAEDGYAVQGGRYGSRGVTLYGNGEAVAVSYSSSTGGRSVYLGKDILGSVKTATTDSGALEDRYEYDAFGTLYQGDLSGGMNLGYLGKPYDSATGLYNYGYRDYSPQAARFTTVDPVRDGNNWYAYVNNDPVNWVDFYGEFPVSTLTFGVVGFVTDAGVSIISDLISNRDVNWTKALVAGAGGFVKGAAIGFVIDTFGLAAPLIAAVAPPITNALIMTGAMSNVFAEAVNDIYEGNNPWEVEKVVTNAVNGATEVMLGESIKALGNSITNMVNQPNVNYLNKLDTASVAPLTVNIDYLYDGISDVYIRGNISTEIVGKFVSVGMDVIRNNNTSNNSVENNVKNK